MFKGELKKLYRNLSIVFLTGALLLCNIFLFYFSIKDSTLYKGGYKKYFSESLKASDPIGYLEEERDILELYEQYNPFTGKFFNEEAFEKEYGEDWVLKQLEKVESVGSSENREDLKDVLDMVLSEWKSALGYDSWKEGVIKSADEVSISIFEKTSNQEKEALKNVYEKLDIEIASPQSQVAIKEVLEFEVNDLFLLLFVMTLVSTLIIKEREGGQLLYYKSMSKGRTKLFIVKLSVIVLVSFSFYLLINIIELILAFRLYGGIDLFASVQSLAFLSSTPYNLTILSFFIIYYLFIFLVLLLIVGLFLLLAFTGFGPLICGGIVVIVYELSVFLFQYFDGVSILPILGEINLFNFLHPYNFIGTLEFYDLGFVLIPKIATLILPLFLSLFLIFIAYRKDLKMIGFSKLKLNLFSFRSKPRSLSLLEFKKIFIKDFGVIAFLLCLLVSFNQISNQSAVTSVHDLRYNSYITSIAERVSQDGDCMLKVQKEEFEELNEALSLAESEAEKSVISRKLEDESAFLDYESSYELRKSVDPLRPIPREDHYRLLYEDNGFTSLTFILLTLCILYMATQSVHREKRYHMDLIQGSSPLLDQSLKYKERIVMLISAILFILINLGYFIKVLSIYPDIDLSIPTNALNNFFYTGLSIPFYLYYLISLFISLLMILLFIKLIFMITKKYKGRLGIIIVATLLLIVPILLGDYLNMPYLKIFYLFYHPYIFILKYGNVVLWIYLLFATSFLIYSLFTDKFLKNH